MDFSDRLNLQKMINANNIEDLTETIQNKKHSALITKDFQKLILLKKQNLINMANSDDFDNICIEQCSFLFTNYTDIYNKIKKDELDLNIFMQFLEILKMIEDGKLNQHEAAYNVGVLLKKLYIDSALKKSNKLDNQNDNEIIHIQPKNVSWNEWKKKYN